MSDNKENVPKIRFPGFTGAWEQRKLGQLADIVRGASPRPIQDPKWFDDGSDIGWLRIADVTEQDGRIHYLEQRISKAGQQKTRVLTDPHLLLSIAATVGKPVVNYVKTGVHDGFLIFQNSKFDREFMFQWLEMFRPKWQKYGQPGSQVNLNSNLVKNQEIMLPSEKEQKKIGVFLSNLDNLITLHQRKLNNVKRLKTGLLQKMFPKNGEDFPEVRLPGFTGAWEQRRFDSMFAPLPNNTFSRAGLNYDDGKIKSVHYGDILIKYGAVTDCGKNVIPFITGAEVSDHQSQLLQDGDVLIADAAEDKTVGKATEIAGITGIPVVSGLHTIACRPKVKMQPNYLGYYMNSPSYHRQLLPLMQGIKVLSISRKNLAKTTICFPASEQEQSQIGKVFADIDNLITLHQRKLEHLQEQKKAFLQQMFV